MSTKSIENIHVRNFQHAVALFMSFIDNLTVYHWTTQSYARHIAAGELVDKMRKHMDKFVEVRLAASSQPVRLERPVTLVVEHHSDTGVSSFLKNMNREFAQLFNELDSEVDRQIITDVMTDIEQTQYLFKFK